MKTLFVAINKGGVGKSMIACQLARYAHSLGLTVLFIDFDDQANSSNHLKRDQIALPYPHSVTKIFCQHGQIEPVAKEEFVDPARITLVQADAKLVTTIVEQSQSTFKEGLTKGDVFFDRFASFMEDISEHFDLCIIDGAPTGDTRLVYGMSVANAVISPIELAQESIEGMGETLNGSRGVLRIQKAQNPSLAFLGFLPNKVKVTQAQLSVLEQVFQSYGKHMFRLSTGGACFIPDALAFKDIQNHYCPVKLKKCESRLSIGAG